MAEADVHTQQEDIPEQLTLPFTGITEDVPQQQVTNDPSQQKTTPDAQPKENAPPQIKSRFVPQDPVKVVKDYLKLPTIDPHLQEMLRAAHMRQTEDGKGLMIDLDENGHSIQLNKLKNGTEFIGVPDKKTIVDAHDAQVMVGLAKSRGWKAINVAGSQQEKERMWLEAQRQGLSVANFQPKPGSEVYKQWQEEKPNAGISQAPEHDFHKETMHLLNDKMKTAEDPAVRDGLKKMLNVYTEGKLIGDENTFKALSDALSDKNSPKDGFNKAVDILTKKDPQLGIGRIEEPGGGTPGPTRTNNRPNQRQASQP